MISISGNYTNPYSARQTPATPRQPTAPASENTSTASPSSSSTTDASTKPFAQVALDARAALDAGYEKLGRKADASTTGEDWRNKAGLGQLDRRSLYAIASNQGGLFSQDEVDTANAQMGWLASQALLPFHSLSDPSIVYKEGIDYLDQASPEEKASLGWAQSRADAERGYEITMREQGREPENVDSGNIFVKLFLQGYKELAATNDPTQDLRNMPSYLKAIDLWNQQSETQQSSFSLFV